MAKRGQGEGTISKRADGTWWARITVGKDKDGKQKRRAFYGKTRAEVQKKLTAALNELNNGIYFEPSKITLGQWLDTWFNNYVSNSVKHSTKVSYAGIINNHIKPVLGNIKLSELRPEMIQKFYNDKLEHGRLDNSGGLSPKTIKNIHNMLHESLEQAFHNGVIQRNVSDVITLPKITKKEMRVLSPDEHKRLLHVTDNEKYGFIVTLALSTGARLGELLGLKWSDIDFNDSSMSIKRTVNRLKNYDKTIESKTLIVVNEPKTKNSIRSIPLSDNTIKKLKIIRTSQKQDMLICGGAYLDNLFVFASPIGEPLEPRLIQDIFKRLLAIADISDANFHCLRHTFATRALEAGIPAKIVSEILGHANVSTTLDLYSHVSLDTKRDAIKKISEYTTY